MTIQDDQYAENSEHAVAMLVRSVVTGVADLRQMDMGQLPQCDVDDLRLAHTQLGRFLNREGRHTYA